MVLLGKTLKGRSSKGQNMNQRRRNIRIRQQNKTMEEIDQEKKLSKKKRSFLKASLMEEERLTRMNKVKILTNWRKIMRVAKTEQLKRDIEIYSQNHEREVEAKDAILNMLDRDLDEAEEQYLMAHRNHLIHVDQLIALQEARLQGLTEEAERDIKILEDEYRLEKEDIFFSHKIEKSQLLDLIATFEEEEKAVFKKAKQEFDSFRDETKNRNIEDINTMRHQLTTQTEQLDRDFEIQFAKYNNDTEKTSKEFEDNFKRNKDKSEEIEKMARDIDRLKERIQIWKVKTEQNAKECQERNAALRKEKNNIAKHYQDLKNRMVGFREEQAKRLSDLTMNTRMCHNKLKELVDLGDRILKTAELCRRLETEKEKVLPFYSTDAEDLEVPEDLIQDLEKYGLNRTFEEFSRLETFYKRFNKVLLDKLAIEKQKSTLENENKVFKSLLKQYLDGVSVNEDVINNQNPLLVVNNKINLNRPLVEKMGGQTVIEGNVVINQDTKQLGR